MSFAAPLRTGLAPCFRLRTGIAFPQQTARSLSTTAWQRTLLKQNKVRAITLSQTSHSWQTGGAQTGSAGFNWSLLGGIAFASTVSAALVSRNSIHCDASSLTSSSSPLDRSSYTSSPTPESSPESIVNVYQLSFGAICGVCAGVFIKKGLKLIAFLLGGGFVLLQYLSSQRLVNVNWGSLGKKYDGIVGSAAGPGSDVKGWQGSTAARIWNRFESFLTANFQERASLLAGLALGLRLG